MQDIYTLEEIKNLFPYRSIAKIKNFLSKNENIVSDNDKFFVERFSLNKWSIDKKIKNIIIDIIFHIPELKDEEILSYLQLYNWLNHSDIMNNLGEFWCCYKLNKNIENFLNNILNTDYDFKSLYDFKDWLLNINSEYFTYSKIDQNLINIYRNHNLINNIYKENFYWYTIEDFPYILPINSHRKNDIIFNEDWLLYKGYFLWVDKMLTFNEFWDLLINKFKILKDSNIFRVRIDFDYVLSLKDYRKTYFPAASYYWPAFSDDKLFDISIHQSFTKKVRDQNDNFSDLESTEFLIDHTKKSMQIEEIKRNDDSWFYEHRYAHMEFCEKSKTITHFDWAIIEYDEEWLISRKNVTLEKNPRYGKNKYKLFRIDWNIPLSDWKGILYHFFYWNYMILEYFDEEKYNEYKKDNNLFWY